MELGYQSFGSGAPLVVLHGLFGSRENWQTLARKWSDAVQVFVVDQRNHGSSPHDDAFDYPTLAADLHDFLAQRGIPRAHVLGHSMGGKTAMEWALTWPNEVCSLIVVDIAPKAYPRHHDEVLSAMYGLDLPGYTARQEIDEALAAQIADLPTRQFIQKNVVRDEGGTFRWRINLDAITSEYDSIIKGIAGDRQYPGPALFVRGEKSTYVQDQDMTRITTLFPQATLTTVPNAGHWVHADAPAAVEQIVRAFLAEAPACA